MTGDYDPPGDPEFPVPADALAKAEEWLQAYVALNATEASMLAEIVWNEYGRRGAEIDRLNANKLRLAEQYRRLEDELARVRGLLREIVANHYGAGDLAVNERLVARAREALGEET